MKPGNTILHVAKWNKTWQWSAMKSYLLKRDNVIITLCQFLSDDKLTLCPHLGHIRNTPEQNNNIKTTFRSQNFHWILFLFQPWPLLGVKEKMGFFRVEHFIESMECYRNLHISNGIWQKVLVSNRGITLSAGILEGVSFRILNQKSF